MYVCMYVVFCFFIERVPHLFCMARSGVESFQEETDLPQVLCWWERCLGGAFSNSMLQGVQGLVYAICMKYVLELGRLRQLWLHSDGRLGSHRLEFSVQIASTRSESQGSKAHSQQPNGCPMRKEARP